MSVPYSQDDLLATPPNVWLTVAGYVLVVAIGLALGTVVGAVAAVFSGVVQITC